jgi:hypothetical protein
MKKRKLPPKKKASKAQDRLRSEGAEFLVLGNLLIRDVQATKAYTNFPAWDVLAVNPESGKQARIQVKSRWATDSGNFLVKNFDCDFVVLVYLNRGYNFGKRARKESGLKEPEFWIFPIQYLKSLIASGAISGRLGDSISFRKNTMPDKGQQFKDNWESIVEFLVRD